MGRSVAGLQREAGTALVPAPSENKWGGWESRRCAVCGVRLTLRSGGFFSASGWSACLAHAPEAIVEKAGKA